MTKVVDDFEIGWWRPPGSYLVSFQTPMYFTLPDNLRRSLRNLYIPASISRQYVALSACNIRPGYKRWHSTWII